MQETMSWKELIYYVYPKSSAKGKTLFERSKAILNMTARIRAKPWMVRLPFNCYQMVFGNLISGKTMKFGPITLKFKCYNLSGARSF